MKKISVHPMDIMTVEQVADYLQLNKLTVYKYVRDGRLPASKLGKSYRIRKADVDWFLDNAKQTAPRSAPARAESRAGQPVPRRAAVAPAPTAEEVRAARPRERGEAGLRREEIFTISPFDIARNLH